MSTTKGAWRLQEVRDQILAGEWVQYDPSNDPAQLWSWGFGSYGRLGDNTTIDKSSPVQIPGNEWNDVSAGAYHSLARKSDGTLWAWGFNSYGVARGVVGDSTTIDRSSPVQIPGTEWNDIDSGTGALARKTDGTLWSWGDGRFGRLGDNTAGTNRSSPVQIPGTEWNDISSGGLVSFARKTDGTLWSWGFNNFGQLGINDTTSHRSSPVQIPGTQWSDISGGAAAFARKTDGTLWAWGDGRYGQLGNNFSGSYPIMTARSSPVQIPGTQWNDINTFTGGHSLARKTDGTLWSWGQNGNGQLGQNNLINRSSPVQIPGNEWNDASAGAGHSHARKTDGTLWSWGSNSSGRLGDNTVINKSSPVQVPGTQWNDITGGSGHTLARKAI